MNLIWKNIFCLLFLLSPLNILPQKSPFAVYPEHLDSESYASWITHPDIKGNEYGVYYFRKEFKLNDKPDSFIINVSADNRYKLFINGIYVTFGPAAGDLNNWNYEKIEISSYLVPGKNIISALVWNWGTGKGPRQISARTAFILQGESENEILINTDSTWRTKREYAYSPIENTEESVRQGYIAGVSEKIDGTKLYWNWNEIKTDSSSWETPLIIGKGASQGLNTWRGITPWILKERIIPLMEERNESISSLCYVKGIEYNTDDYNGNLNLKVPSNSSVEFLLDNKVLTMGYPSIIIDGGENSIVTVSYQEALFNKDGTKGNRDEWQNKELKGVKDIYLPDGGKNRYFEPLWIRIFRYIKISVQTKEDELFIKDFHNRYTAYPFSERADFESDNEELTRIWDASWRTARLCALETYMDCPYYEQIQYIGDARIQSLISIFVANDDRLMKNAIEQFYASMQPMGLTKSAHPTSGIQIIPPFSLYFILMLHDYFMYGSDSDFVEQFLPGVRFILNWFLTKVEDEGMLGPLPYWNHIDGGTAEFDAGSPPGAAEGRSAHMSILLAYTLDHCIELFDYYGSDYDSGKLKEISEILKRNTIDLCFDTSKELIAETPDKNLFSQHTNIFAILADLFDDRMNMKIAEKLLSDKTLAQTTLYFDFYLFQALKKAGLGGEILTRLERWSDFLDQGLSTFPEHGIESRSDCHAWSAHPIYDLLNITCGIESIEPGFRGIRISPNPGNLKYFISTMQHDQGKISIEFKKEPSGTELFRIYIPDNLKGEFNYKMTFKKLNSGWNGIKIGS